MPVAERGGVIEVTRRRRPVARLMPLESPVPASGWADLEAWTRSIFRDRLIVPGGSDIVKEERDER